MPTRHRGALQFDDAVVGSWEVLEESARIAVVRVQAQCLFQMQHRLQPQMP